ncbi:EAL domain-containing protein, partial [Gammaproteobacteria bacterium]|nr:EAL domain-containing protein [Gammaproteobacteria bacterium]
FGKGYTSISHLKKFPVSGIKIDRSYIKGLPNNVDDCAIVDAIISLAKCLGVIVSAEGVEDSDQLQYLSEKECDIVQGYLLYYPMNIKDLTSNIKRLRDKIIT